MKTYDRIYNLVRKIPKGKVSTYGQIGYMLNLNPRVIGWALNKLAKDIPSQKIPWQRVINSKGKISTNKLLNIPLDLQRHILEKEGVLFDEEDKIDFSKYLWSPTK